MVSVTITVAVMLRLFLYNIAVAISKILLYENRDKSTVFYLKSGLLKESVCPKALF